MTVVTSSLCQTGQEVIRMEAQALLNLSMRLGKSFEDACERLLTCKGRVILTGMGKSGHIAGKIAATLASTGTPAFFVHPGEASHGDLGMVTGKDCVLAISHSGETAEILVILPMIKLLGVRLIAFTGNPRSTLAQHAEIHLDLSIDKEACPHNLTPTTSTTMALAMGDAMAVAILSARGFGIADFAKTHPGGALGKRLLLQVKDVMRKGSDIPVVDHQATLRHTLIEMTQKTLGMTIIVNAQGQLAGIFTDGDLRRTLNNKVDLELTPIEKLMTAKPKTIASSKLASEALHIMEKHHITSLVVSDNQRDIMGVIHLHDLLHAGIAR